MLKWKIGVTAMALVALSTLQAGAEPGVSKDTIKIGMFAPMTGTSAIFGRYTIGARAYYNMINAQGGVNGRKIEVVLEDDACNPATAVAATKRLVSQEGVFAIHAGVCTAAVMAVKKELQRENVPFMNLGAAGASLVDPIAPNLFSPLPNTSVVAQTLVNFAMSRPDTKRLAIISHPDDWGKSQFDPAVQLLKEKYKIEFVENVTMERGATDITPQILKLRAAKPDVVVSFLYPTETAIFVRSAHKYGLDAPLLGCFGAPYEDTVRRVDDPEATKNLYIFHALGGAADGPEMAKWVDMIKKYGTPDGTIRRLRPRWHRRRPGRGGSAQEGRPRADTREIHRGAELNQEFRYGRSVGADHLLGRRPRRRQVRLDDDYDRRQVRFRHVLAEREEVADAWPARSERYLPGRHLCAGCPGNDRSLPHHRRAELRLR
ncbi:ABC transporter substrate-binding protein [Bradyrhizobium sp. LM2.9]